MEGVVLVKEVGDQHHGGVDGGRNQGGALDEGLGDTQKSIHGGGTMMKPYHPAAQDWLPTEAKQG